MSAEVDVPFTNPDAFTGGGNFLTPADVFNPDTGFEKVLQATGASRAQAAQVQDSFSSIGNSVTKFFSNLFTPSDVTDSNASSVGQKASTSSSEPTSPSGQSASPSGNSYSAGDFLKSTPGKIATGAAAVAGGAAATGLGLQYVTDSINKSLGLPSGSGIGGVIVIFGIFFVLILGISAVK